MDKQIGDIHRILTGNGHPENGLVFRLVRLEESQRSTDRSRRRIWAVVLALATGVVGFLGESVRSVWFSNK